MKLLLIFSLLCANTVSSTPVRTIKIDLKSKPVKSKPMPKKMAKASMSLYPSPLLAGI